MKKTKSQNTGWIDVYDDDLMVKLGMRPPRIAPKCLDVWTKTEKEKRLLKILRKTYKDKAHFGNYSHKYVKWN